MSRHESPLDERFERDLRQALRDDAYSRPMPERAALVARVQNSLVSSHGWHLAALATTVAMAVVVVVVGLSLAGRLPRWEVAAQDPSASLVPTQATTPSMRASTAPPDRSGQVQAGWILYSVSGDQVVIGVDEGCAGFEGVDVLESGTTVDIRAWVGNPSPSAICLQVRLYHAVTVSLVGPLGDRELTGCLVGTAPDDTRTDCTQPPS
jgi:hypothetical protein